MEVFGTHCINMDKEDIKMLNQISEGMRKGKKELDKLINKRRSEETCDRKSVKGGLENE